MCAQNPPICLGVLHAIRLEAAATADACATWLTFAGLHGAQAPVRALAGLLGADGHVAPPGEPTLWPHEQAVLEALARVEREPVEAENLLGFLPGAARAAGLALLSELSRHLSAELASRLKLPTWNTGLVGVASPTDDLDEEDTRRSGLHPRRTTSLKKTRVADACTETNRRPSRM